jgi:hypothetical protein
MPFSFPASPSVGATSTQNGRQFQWTGYAWELVAAAAGGSGLSWSSVPASATASGTAGEIAYDNANGFFYVATAANTWKRAALSSWTLDPYWSSVSLLLHFDGNLTDSSPTPKTITAVGNAAATGAAKFGSASLAMDGDGDGLTVSDGMPRGSEDFTVEFWVYKNTAWAGESSYRVLYEWADDAVSFGVQCYLNNSNNLLTIASYGGPSSIITYAASNFSAATWYHLAVTRSGSTMTLWVNGTAVATGTYSGSFGSTPGIQAIGIGSYLGNFGANSSWPGRIDEFRVTRGVARTITAAPTAAYPDETPPTIAISAQPSNQTASSGAATFSVTASVTLGGSVTYQWQKSDDAGSTWANVSGATSSSLALSSLTNGSDNADQYRVVVSSTGAASVTSSAATLTVASSSPPLSLAGTRPSNLASGTTADGYTLTGTGTSGSPSVLRIGGGNNNDYRVWLIVNQTGTLNWTVTASSESGYDGGRLYTAGAPANYTAGGFNEGTAAGYANVSNWLSGTQTQTGTTSVTAGQHIVLRWVRDDGGDSGNNRIEATLSIA